MGQMLAWANPGLGCGSGWWLSWSVKGLILWNNNHRISMTWGNCGISKQSSVEEPSENGVLETRDLEPDQWLIVVNICQ